jgi:hypothetical protein
MSRNTPFCGCGNHKTKKLYNCVEASCSHTPCGNCMFGGTCVCHFEVKLLSDLETKIKKLDTAYAFYVGSYDRKDFWTNYVRKPHTCTRDPNFDYATTELKECWYWTGSSNLIHSENVLLKCAFQYKAGQCLNNDQKAKTSKVNNPSSNYVYVRIYDWSTVKKTKKTK